MDTPSNSAVLDISEEPPLQQETAVIESIDQLPKEELSLGSGINAATIETCADVAAVLSPAQMDLSPAQMELMKKAEEIAPFHADHKRKKVETDKLYRTFKSVHNKRDLVQDAQTIIALKNGSLDPAVRKILQNLISHASADTATVIRETPPEGIDVASLLEEINREKRQVLETLKPKPAPFGKKLRFVLKKWGILS